METLYRKVTFEINDKNHDEILLIGKSANFIFNPNTRNGEELSDFLAGCEEITDTSHQIEKMEAEKAELLDVLEKISKVTNEGYMTDHTDFQVWESELKQVHNEIKSLIQKHKQ